MANWAKILCAVDFSDGSRAALEHAADLARRLGADLALIHVREAPRVSVAKLVAPPEVVAADADELRRKLDAWREQAERIAGRPVRMILESGSPARGIVHRAENEKCDLVVTGSHGRKGLRRLVLGSVAEHVVRHAPCAVLVARRQADGRVSEPYGE